VVEVNDVKDFNEVLESYKQLNFSVSIKIQRAFVMQKNIFIFNIENRYYSFTSLTA
jgi:hypothetical protein